MDASNQLSSISKANSDQAIGEFWDTHDFADFDTDAPDIDAEVVLSVPVEANLLSAIAVQARSQGISVENLVNQWLKQKLAEKSVA